MSTEVETPVVAPAVTEDKKEIIEEEAAKAAEEAKAAAEKKDEEKKPEEADKKARLTSTQTPFFRAPTFLLPTSCKRHKWPQTTMYTASQIIFWCSFSRGLIRFDPLFQLWKPLSHLEKILIGQGVNSISICFFSYHSARKWKSAWKPYKKLISEAVYISG